MPFGLLVQPTLSGPRCLKRTPESAPWVHKAAAQYFRCHYLPSRKQTVLVPNICLNYNLPIVQQVPGRRAPVPR